jgi:AcrR family transcriptional regulator
MGRRAHFDNDQFLDAALKLLAAGGPAAVTVAGIAETLGAPVGSVYHRFPSRDVILAGLWLRTANSFQRGFLELLDKGEAVEAALYTVRWARAHPEEGQLLLLHRQEELTWGPWPEEMKVKAAQLAKELEAGFRRFANKRFGRVSKKTLERTVFALADVPLAAVRRCLQAGKAPPPSKDEFVRETCLAVLRRKR